MIDCSMEKESEPKIVYCKICLEPYVVDKYYTKDRHLISIQHLHNVSEEENFNYGKVINNARNSLNIEEKSAM